MHCWWGESASYVLSLLKSFLMEWKPYILFPNEAQEWQTAPPGLSCGCLQVGASSPSPAAPGDPAGGRWTGTADGTHVKWSVGPKPTCVTQHPELEEAVRSPTLWNITRTKYRCFFRLESGGFQVQLITQVSRFFQVGILEDPERDNTIQSADQWRSDNHCFIIYHSILKDVVKILRIPTRPR